MAEQIRRMSELESEAYKAGVAWAEAGEKYEDARPQDLSPLTRAAFQRGYENMAGEVAHG